MSEEKEFFYLCDPEKNTKCRKIGCRYNQHRNNWMKCEMTSNVAYAKLDENGKPIITLVKEYSGEGKPKIRKFAYKSDD